jgi:hypothetical protein
VTRKLIKPGLALALVLLPVAVYTAILVTYRLRPVPPPPRAAIGRSMRILRHALDGRPLPQAPELPGAKDPLPGPLWVTLYLKGEPVFRFTAGEDTSSWGQPLADAIRAAARAIREDARVTALSAEVRQRVRIKLDLCTAEGPIFTGVPLMFAKSVVPGLDGLGLEVDGRRAYLLPDDLFRRELLSGHQPFYFMHEFRTGLDLKRVVNLLADELGVTKEQWRKSERRFFRFRVASFVEEPGGGVALAVKRSRVPVHRIDRATVRRAVERAADYVLRQMVSTGRFHYIYYPLEGRPSPSDDYSLPRHAGTTWFLSLAYRVLGAQRFKQGAQRAIEYLGANAVPLECKLTPYACVGSSLDADLGSAALTVVAICEYQQATGDRRFETLARRLGRFLLWMQKDNGDFCHQYKPGLKEKNCKDILLYYTGEASLALAKLYQLTKDPTYLGPLERALDFLVGEKYDFFLGQFFVSEDHWTCIAAEAAPPSLHKERYARFCYAFAGLNRRAQVPPGEGPMEDLWGAFALTALFMPHNTPAGSRTEANVATYLLSQKRGEPQPEILDTIRRSVRYLVDQQLRPESAYLFPDPEAAVGGMMQTPLRASIRIDYVQHAAAAMARALPLIPERSWPE